MIVRRFFENPKSYRDPFEELDRMRRDLGRFLGDYESGRWESPSGVFPLTNITEDKDNFYIRAELPGIKADDLDISITGNSLSISGQRSFAMEDQNVKYHRRERESGTFRRMIKLPSLVDTNKVEARSAEGVLTITLPKAEETKPRQIPINAR
jgi:HSP20 family protein